MNFGAFAGGFSTGFNSGVNMGKTLRDVIKEKKLQDLRDAGMAEAESQRASTVQSMIKENGTTGQPASGPVNTDTPKVETAQPAPAETTATPAATAATTPVQAAPTATPSAAGAATPEAATPSAPATPAPASAAATGMPARGPMTHDGLPARKNADGTHSTEVSITVTHPNLNGGKPTNIPSLWGGKEVDEETAVKNALASGKKYQAFGSIEEAVSSAQARSNAGGASAAPATPPAPAAPASPAAKEAPATPVQKPSGKFTVNGQSYETREQALAAAEKAAPTAQDLFMKNAVPKLAAQYMANGNPEKAKAWTDYAESHNGKRAIKDWAAAYSAPDFDTAATRFGKYYTEHINDGVDYTGHKMLTKEDGTQVAVVTLKDKATGKAIEMEMTREKMLAMGAANNPQKLFETEQARQLAAEKTKIEAKVKAQQRREDFDDKRKLESEKQDRIDEREAGKATSKKVTDPTERRALIRSDEMKNNPKFARMSKDEQNKVIDAAMETVYGKDANGEKPAVVIAEKPVPYNKDLPVKYRKSDGKAFHVVDGQYIPIEGAVPANPAAGGLPQKK